MSPYAALGSATWALSSGAAGALYVLTRADDWGLLSPKTLAARALCVFTALIWTLWSLRARHPIVDLRLARQPLALSVHVTSFIAGAGMYVVMTVTIVLPPDADDRRLGTGD